MKKIVLMTFIAVASIAVYSSPASALCKKYPTKAENRNGAIGEILNDHNVDAIGASGEHPCMNEKEVPTKTPHKKKADAGAKQNNATPAAPEQTPAANK